MELNRQIVDKFFDRYPKLRTIVCAGTISLKAAREILLIDRYEMNNLYLDLIEAGAVTAASGYCMRATPLLREYVAELTAKESMKEIVR